MPIDISLLDASEAETAISVVSESFTLCVAPDYTPEGRALFARVVTADYLRSLPYRRGFVLVAKDARHMVGLLALRDGHHITLFFVSPVCQGQGIGRRLFDAALARVRRDIPTARALEVHSSPIAVPVYKSLGFHVTGPEKTDGGIRYIPMEFPIPQEN